MAVIPTARAPRARYNLFLLFFFTWEVGIVSSLFTCSNHLNSNTFILGYEACIFGVIGLIPHVVWSCVGARQKSHGLYSFGCGITQNIAVLPILSKYISTSVVQMGSKLSSAYWRASKISPDPILRELFGGVLFGE
jgi:hypothetical protein